MSFAAAWKGLAWSETPPFSESQAQAPFWRSAGLLLLHYRGMHGSTEGGWQLSPSLKTGDVDDE